jgi:chorismate synthase
MALELPKNISPSEKIKLLRQLEEEKKKKAKELEDEVSELEQQIEKDEEVAEVEERQVRVMMERELEKLRVRLKEQETESLENPEGEKESKDKPAKKGEKKKESTLEQELAATQVSEEARRAMNLGYNINVGKLAGQEVYDTLVNIRNKAAANEYITRQEQEFLNNVKDPIEAVYKNINKYETARDSFDNIMKERRLLGQIEDYKK